MSTQAPSPVVLVAAAEPQSLAVAMEGARLSVLEARSATLAIEWARELRPDVIVLDSDLPDMSGVEACRVLHDDTRIERSVPILMLAADTPTPVQRVAALRAGVWDFLSRSADPAELRLKLQTYVQVRRNIEMSAAGGLLDPVTGLHTRPALARRARELGALMARSHGALACVVVALDAGRADPAAGRLIARASRVSDVVGTLGPTEFAILAPSTDESGAVSIGRRLSGALRDTLGGDPPLSLGSTLRVGYDAVTNLTYSPIDPVELLTRAATAARNGIPHAECPWVRRFDHSTQSRPSPTGLVPDLRRSTP